MEQDLPALRAGGLLDLPRLAVAERRHEPPLARVYPAWSSYTSQVEVRGVACGADGDVWLATAGGVLRWRAGLERFTRYASEHGLPGNGMRAIVVAPDGAVWALSDGGRLARLARDEWALAGLPAATCLATDADGGVWAAAGGAVQRLDADREPIPLDGAPEHPRALAVRGPQDVWVAGAEGVFQFDGAGWRRRLRHPAVTALVRDASGLWVGSARGLEYADLVAGRLLVPAGLPAGPVAALALAPAGVWAAIGGLVGRAAPDGWSLLPGARPAPVTALAAGDEVLIGTRAGLLRATEQSEPVPHVTAQPPDVIGLAAADGEAPSIPTLVQALGVQPTAAGATVWLGTSGGLFAFDEALARWRQVAPRRVGDVRALAPGEGRALWVGTWRDGLRALVEGRLQAATSGVSGPVTALAPALAGGAWAGGPASVHRYEEGEGWARVLGPAQLPDGAWVRALVDAHDGLWIGTSAGLLRLDGTRAEVPAAALRDRDVRALLAAGGDLLAGTARGLHAAGPGPVAGLETHEITALACWGDAVLVGTAHGLHRADRVAGAWSATRLASSTDSGLAAERVTALAPDAGSGRVWIGTASGLSCLLMEG